MNYIHCELKAYINTIKADNGLGNTNNNNNNNNNHNNSNNNLDLCSLKIVKYFKVLSNEDCKQCVFSQNRFSVALE